MHIIQSELEPPIFPESIGVKSCHHHEVQYKVSRSTRFHRSNVLCVLPLTCDSRIQLQNMFHPKKLMFGFRKKKNSKKAPQKKTSNAQNSFPNGTLPSNFGVSSVSSVSSGSRGATDMSCNLKPMIIKSNLGGASNHRLGSRVGSLVPTQTELPGRKIFDGY